jgi:predicted nucleic acid-binding protein
MRPAFGLSRTVSRTESAGSIQNLLIAATTLEYDLALLTRNVRHFERIPGLLIIHQH